MNCTELTNAHPIFRQGYVLKTFISGDQPAVGSWNVFYTEWLRIRRSVFSPSRWCHRLNAAGSSAENNVCTSLVVQMKYSTRYLLNVMKAGGPGYTFSDITWCTWSNIFRCLVRLQPRPLLWSGSTSAGSGAHASLAGLSILHVIRYFM